MNRIRSAPGLGGRLTVLADYFVEIGGPVGLPGLAAVAGESLLPVSRVGLDAGPGEPHLDGLAPQGVIGIEETYAVHELAAYRRAQVAGGVAAVEPPDGPGGGLGVIGAHRDAVVGAVGPVEAVVVHVSVAAHGEPEALLAIVVEPVVAAGEALLEHVIVNTPATGAQVEGVKAGEVVALTGLLVVLGGEGQGAHERRSEKGGVA